MPFDLHVHSAASDGSLPAQRVVEIAATRGLTYLSLTDHDTMEGYRSARQHLNANPGLTLQLIPGVEMSAQFEETSVHILGYFIEDETPDLSAAFEYAVSARRTRSLKVIDALHDGGLPISRDAFLKTGLTVNRLNIARFLLDVGAIANVREFFTSFAGQGCPYYVPRRDMPVQEAIQTIREAGGLPVLAHPARSHATDLIEPLSHLGLTGVEAWHSAHTVEQATTLEQLADSLGLLVTGGSDWHGDKGHHHDLASSKLPPERLARFLAADPRAHRCP